MSSQEDLITLDGPIAGLPYPDQLEWSAYPTGIIYSIQLSNGMVITSPENFRRLKEDGEEAPSRTTSSTDE